MAIHSHFTVKWRFCKPKMIKTLNLNKGIAIIFIAVANEMRRIACGREGASMLITRECDYAVRVLRAMADERRVSVNEICERELLTAPFAYKILKKLQKAGLVRGYRGVNGGYSLNCNLDEITLYDVYTVIDPNMFIIDCLEPGYNCARNDSDGRACSVHCELVEIQEELCRMLKQKPLRKLING